MKIQHTKISDTHVISVLREWFKRNTGLLQERRKTTNNLTIHLKKLEKRRKKNEAQISRRKEIIKMKLKYMKQRPKRKQKILMKLRAGSFEEIKLTNLQLAHLKKENSDK